ncbi:hypothetical protein FDG2_2292 [Candidatus Protofrankia californiensis]|uniref:Uncharacterized protein n=1 Tax=Candidatus Protofrankia californiensis TaxID=1839754 RepID=A0A1C3NXA4_9ACTN|nr:hypothetical protein FDG2_2292 [Candidatus Protofrankia californiensis]
MTARELVSGLAFIARDVWRPSAKLDLYLHGDVCGGAAPHFTYRQMISAARVNPMHVSAPPEPVCCAMRRKAHRCALGRRTAV